MSKKRNVDERTGDALRKLQVLDRELRQNAASWGCKSAVRTIRRKCPFGSCTGGAPAHTQPVLRLPSKEEQIRVTPREPRSALRGSKRGEHIRFGIELLFSNLSITGGFWDPNKTPTTILGPFSHSLPDGEEQSVAYAR